MRLIDADALIEAHYDYCMKHHGEADVFYTWSLELIRNAPTVKRIKGEWIPMPVSSGRDSWKCSVCGRRARGKKENLPFCHCGADMRGKSDETN